MDCPQCRERKEPALTTRLGRALSCGPLVWCVSFGMTARSHGRLLSLSLATARLLAVRFFLKAIQLHASVVDLIYRSPSLRFLGGLSIWPDFLLAASELP